LRSKDDSSRSDGFEGFDQPLDGPVRVIEPIDEHPRLPAKPLSDNFRQSVTALRSSAYGDRIFFMAASS
jgi:hypothetical protein